MAHSGHHTRNSACPSLHKAARHAQSPTVSGSTACSPQLNLPPKGNLQRSGASHRATLRWLPFPWSSPKGCALDMGMQIAHYRSRTGLAPKIATQQHNTIAFRPGSALLLSDDWANLEKLIIASYPESAAIDCGSHADAVTTPAAENRDVSCTRSQYSPC